MPFKLCDRCGLNYIQNPADELCCECGKKTDLSAKKTSVDDNKIKVVNDLLPLLRKMSPAATEAFTTKEVSFKLLGLRLPLLVECAGLGEIACRKEITKGSSGVYRYYKDAFDINGKKYHICSQWWSATSNNSKDILELIKDVQI